MNSRNLWARTACAVVARTSYKRITARKLLLALLLLITVGNATAQEVTPDTVVGDMVTHPATGATVTVVAVLENFAVLTDSNDVILIFTNVGDTFTPTNGTTTVTVISNTIDPDTMLAVQIVVDPNDPMNPPDPPLDHVEMVVARSIDQEVADAIAAAAGAAGDPGGDIEVTIPAGNVNVFARRRVGASGGDGNDGYGIEICDPTGLLGCAIIGYSGTNGEAGSTPSAMNYTITVTNNGNIQSITDGLAGISVVSIGGNGGDGGDAYGNFDGRRGGNAGAGGTVNVTSYVDIATSGSQAHGMFGQSRAGVSGDGGSGYIFGGGGDGGRASQGGTVNLTNNGAINTLGEGSHGMLAQSLGGSAGSGGDSWGLVGSGGSSRLGGHGGTATVTNNNTIVTAGIRSHGMMAQSVGGTGGDGGDAGGIVAFGGSGSAGGNGGTARATNSANAQIVTTGDRSIGVFAQSIGGGGGDGGASGGVVAFGGSGSAGGNGGTVTVSNAVGSTIQTSGEAAHGVLAQSVGGGGGNGASSGGVVALGGSGSSAGNGGSVTVNNGADITTSGVDARGLFVQSIGGGGGSASGTAGFVSLGGRGGSGGNGGSVVVTNTGTIITQASGGDAIYAQSVGGGGGSGAASGGVVSIGGSGNSGGSASSVVVTNSGTLATGADDSRGILAQSIGGGGGSGGVSGGLIVIGGSGSRASNGSTVQVINNGSIATNGIHSSAIQAQSIGGGGGDGGTTGGVFLRLGGRGGGGGSANVVTVESNRNLITAGNDSHGIFAQSVGGGGGNGGNASSGSLFVGVSIGGSGGNGGNGSTVNVTTNEYDIDLGAGPVSLLPLIQTSGDRAFGVLAQSIGGGGGDGGFAVQAAVGTFVSVSVAIGGSAGNGGTGGQVNVNTNVAVITAGENSDGIVAQSIGGGGGNGGFAISGSIQANPIGGGAVAIGVGGSGGGGGNGGAVNVDFTGSIQTSGELSEGIIAQSLGGGGGSGGFSIAGSISLGGTGSGAVSVGVGGSGGSGGNGGAVTATADGTVITQGDRSTGVLFQSVGGGGGNGGFNISAAVSGGVVGSGAVNVGVGGAGASGGNGAAVDGTVNGLVSTAGDYSSGVIIQSVGGGGGSGGFNIGLSGSGAGIGTGAVNVGIGGSGDRGGAGGTVVANVAADVSTTGRSATAVLIQSIGGGGGNGGFNITGALAGGGPSGAVNVAIGGGGGGGGDGATVTASFNNNIETMGDFSSGILVQSVGGGGGQAALNIGLAAGLSGVGVSFGLGGAPGDAGDGANVSVTHRGDITTNGVDSTGIHVQSIGGGGGNAALNIASGYSSIGKIDVGIGRVGGVGGSGGTVTVSTDGTITTFGDNSIGVLAQSIGNGGGKSGAYSFGVSIQPAKVALGLSLGLQGGQGGTADAVDVTTRGRIQTAGIESHAIYAQSVGGGGGIGGMSLLPVILSSTIGASIGGEGGTGGASGAVTVDNFAELLTLGDESNGIFAQSIGGGGGNGGIAVTGGIQTGPIGATLTVGGTGGTGAVSGDVIVTNTGIIDTRGLRSNGVFAQSLGGGGGNGGLTISGVLTVGNTPGTNLAIAVVIGGEGGIGAEAGDTRVTNTGIIATSGDEANGIYAQSIGGGGGNGGLTVNLLVDRTAGGGQIGITIGGSGGTGGTGGRVTVDNMIPADGGTGGIIFTTGAGSHGIYAQSIGGGGGNGSSVLALNGTSGAGNLQVGFALGGSGGTGGTGGTVTVTNTGLIETQGDGSHGIYAQSIGGGGGNGGLAIAANVVLSAEQATSFTPLFVMGGVGGGGNDGGNVVVNNSGGILTSGVAAHGIVAQSIGGGGGDGALSIGVNTSTGPATQLLALAGPLFSALGGTGGSGGLGGDVTVNHSGDITTLGEGSEAIVAQSINGGGGGMRLDFSGITSIEDQVLGGFDPDYTGTRWENDDNGNGALLRFDLGAFDVQNSGGGTVTVNSTGTINTLGADSIGQSMQGIGGGGGVLQFTVGLSPDGTGFITLPLTVRLGGVNGRNNDGGDLTAAHSGNHLSNGIRAHGALLQSIGGGGGRSTVRIGLGGGHEADLALVLGGRGGTNESGGAISYQRDGDLITTGDQAFGTAAQSIGGGGGVGAFEVSQVGDPQAGPAVVRTAITLGAESGTSLHGGDIDVYLSGNLLTQGTQAHGLFMQSIGAGGGVALFSGLGNTFDVTLGSGGASGNGGAINLANNGNIWTTGAMAHGVFLQSIGGGGGAVFIDADGAQIEVTLNNAGSGDGGAISFTQVGNISVTGAGSSGIFAQSLGGGGGVVNDLFAGAAGGTGSGGSIDLLIGGDVLAMADGASAIYVQSDGADGGGDITISMPGNFAIIGGAGGVGISILGGNNNVITINGTVATLDGLDGVAIEAGESTARGNDTVFNFGTVFGSVMLGNGDNFFRNEVDAVFLSGSSVQLDIERYGSAAVGALINFGTLAPGGTGRIIETIVDGRYVQADTGLYLTELDLSRTSAGPQADRLAISGSALLAGTINVSMLNVGYVLPGQHSDIIFGAAGGIGAFEGMAGPTSPLGTIGTTPTINLTGIPISAVASFEITYPNDTDVVLSSNIDFAPDGLNRNQSSLGEHINNIQLAGGTFEFAPVTEKIFFTETLGELVDSYDQLSPYPYADALSHSLLSNAQFGERLLSCFARRGAVSSSSNSRCQWLRLGSRSLDRDATAEHLSYEQDSIELSGGMEFRMDGDRSLAWGLSFLRSESISAQLANTESDLYQVGLMYKRPLGRFSFAAYGSAGRGSFETARVIDLPPVVSGIVTASPDISFVSAHGRLVHDLVRERYYVRTSFDIGFNYLNLSGFTEEGGSAVGLEVSSMNDTFLSLHPSIEIGGHLGDPGRAVRVRPYGRLGYLGLGIGGAPGLAAKFVGAQDEVDPFAFESGLERDYFELALGLDVLSSEKNLFRIEANGIKGDATTGYGFEASWTYLFN